MKTKKPTAKKTKPAVAKKASAKTKKPLLSRKTTKVAVKKAQPKRKSKTMAATRSMDVARRVEKNKESGFKRFFYMVLSIIFGLLLGTFVHLFLELAYFKEAIKQSATLEVHHYLGIYSFLPIPAVMLSLLAGLIFGVWLGNWGWRTVYIEHKHRMFKKA